MCVLSIELIWVEIYGKKEEKHNFWVFPRSGTGTKQYGTGTILVLVDWYRYRKAGTGTQCSILDSVSILAITWSFIIRFE